MTGEVHSAQTLTLVTDRAGIRELLTRQLYTAPELIRLTGMTRKQVSYWAHIGLLQPCLRKPDAVPGKPAVFYSGAEVVKAFVVCELRRRGFSLRQVQQIARNLHQQDIQLYESHAYLLTDGYSVYYAFSDTQVVDVLKNHRQALLLIPIHEQVAKLQGVA